MIERKRGVVGGVCEKIGTKAFFLYFPMTQVSQTTSARWSRLT